MKTYEKVLICASIAAAAACGSGGSTYGSGNPTGPTGGSPQPNTIDASQALAFNPSSLTVTVGTSVTWVFGVTQHNVTFTSVTGVPADIPNSSSANVSRTFGTAGTFAYHCTIHPQMTGTVIVH